MLDMILQILAVLGMILLALLAVFLIIVLLVLFFPVTYGVYGKKDDEGIQCFAKIKWLFGLLRIKYSYPEQGHLTVKALWFTLYDTVIPGGSTQEEYISGEESSEFNKETGRKDSRKKKLKKGKTKKEKTKKEKTKKGKSTRAKDEKTKSGRTKQEGIKSGKQGGTSGNADANSLADERITSGDTDANSLADGGATSGNTDATSTGKPGGVLGNTDENHTERDSEEEAKTQENPDEGDEPEGIDKIFLKFQKIKYTICGIYDKIKKIWKNISYYMELLQEKETKQLLQYALFRMGNILKQVRPRHIKANILFGTGAPDTTGYIYGTYCVLSSVMGVEFLVTPDFEQAVFRGEVDISGHITIWVLVWNGLKLFFDQRLRKFLKKLKANA